ncbi:Calcium uniporter protein 6 [Diplonema papillatum]|nr:Calcium uniporter protein 6 [Diplonema papillatum]
MQGTRWATRCLVPKAAFLSLRWCAAPATLQPSLEDIRVRHLSLDVQDQLRTSKREIFGKRDYYTLCGEVGMTRAEAENLLQQLDQSGAVHVEGDAIHLFPLAVYAKFNEHYGLGEADPCPEVTEALRNEEFEELSVAKHRADEAIAKQRRRFWAAVSAGSAAQMGAFAYLTFPPLSGSWCFGWDIIEPISFFIMQGYVVLWFLYFFYTGREHTLSAWDERSLLRMSQAEYEKREVDIVRWAELKKQDEELRRRKAAFERKLE